MKYYEKRYECGFRIIYLHDIYAYDKCNVTTEPEDNVLYRCPKFIPKEKTVPKKLCHDTFKGIKPFPFKTQDLLNNSEFLSPFTFNKYSPKKVLKKKNFSSMHSKSSKSSRMLLGNHEENNNEKISSKSVKNKTKGPDESPKFSCIKKQPSCSSKKASGFKVPGKGTLKRKRWFYESLKKKNDNYEDDLFEDQKFSHFRSLLVDESDTSENYEGLKTPVFPFSISPRERSPSPAFKNCFSPTQLSISRKGAEEYQYRRKKRRKLGSAEKAAVEAPPVDTEKRAEDVHKNLEQVVVELLNIQKANAQNDSDDDPYFSDLLSCSSKANP